MNKGFCQDNNSMFLNYSITKKIESIIQDLEVYTGSMKDSISGKNIDTMYREFKFYKDLKLPSTKYYDSLKNTPRKLMSLFSFCYFIHISSIDTNKGKIQFVITYRAGYFLRFIKPIQYYINVNNRHVFVTLDEKINPAIFNSFDNFKKIDSNSQKLIERFEKTSLLFHGNFPFYICDINKRFSSIKKYYDISVLPKKLRKKTSYKSNAFK